MKQYERLSKQSLPCLEGELDRCVADNYLHSLVTFYRAAVLTRRSVALWYQPDSQGYQGVASLTRARKSPVDFHTFTPAFIFAPFLTDSDHPPLQIDADVHLDPSGLYHTSLLSRNVAAANGYQPGCSSDTFLAAYQHLLTDPREGHQSWYTPADTQRGTVATQGEHQHLVQKAVDVMRTGKTRKIVLSHIVESRLPLHFDPALIFLNLCARYPQAFVSLVAIPEVGTWIGASPELLLAVDDHGIRTAALAGTQRKCPEQPLHTVVWGPKEIEEQAMVTEYVRHFFRTAGVSAVQENGPHTVLAGAMVHLQTTFRAELPPMQRWSVANQVLAKLHPTPAVCGVLKDHALDFILAHEPYDRTFYSGYLGPVHIGDTSQLYVNLRCMQLYGDHAHLYVGSGITSQSDPLAEWRETTLKAETLMDVLHPKSRQPSTQAWLGYDNCKEVGHDIG